MSPEPDDEPEFRWHDVGPRDHDHPYGAHDLLGDPDLQPAARHLFWNSSVRQPKCDPIGDLREGAAVVVLERSLTAFERIVVRAGLTNGFDFPR